MMEFSKMHQSFARSQITHAFNMKFAIAILAVLATANAYKLPDLGKGPLAKDLQDFVNLVPTDKITAIVLEYAAVDPVFQAVLEFIKTPEFKQLITEIQNLQEVKNLLKYLYDAGVDVYNIVNHINKLLGLPEITPVQSNSFGTENITGGLKGLVEDIKAVLPLKKIKELFNYKLKTSTVFANFIKQLSSPEFQKIVDTVAANPTFQKIVGQLKAAGINLQVIVDLLKSILGITIRPGNF